MPLLSEIRFCRKLKRVVWSQVNQDRYQVLGRRSPIGTATFNLSLKQTKLWSNEITVILVTFTNVNCLYCHAWRYQAFHDLLACFQNDQKPIKPEKGQKP